ncbi:sensor histidine kinase [Azospirillum sp. TSO35-2]|uniref:sensor histidine kinase n=1 Tax=Azospirillum sp. TSO35-2 TaxID=716796 RepID=UPI000D64E11B|nr:sensor histidine kinase [Azospirillum sp. TSO35-2]
MTLAGPPHDAGQTVKADRLPSPRLRRMARRLGLGAGLSAGVVAVALAVAAYDFHQRAERDVLAALEVQADSLADRTKLVIQAAAVLLDRVTRLGEDTDWADPASAPRVSAELRRLRTLLPPVVRLGLWDTAARPLATTESNLAPGLSIADRPYFTVHAERGAGGHNGLEISTPLSSIVDGSAILVLSHRLNRPDGGFAGVATLSVRPAEIAADLMRDTARPLMGDVSRIRWRHRDGQDMAVLSRPDGEPAGATVRRMVGDHPLLVEVTATGRAVLDRWMATAPPALALDLMVSVLLAVIALVLLRWSTADEASRNALTALAGRLRRTNIELEEHVSERTQALAQRDLLLREVNHRLKNSLQLAASLVQMQRQIVESPDTRQQLTDTVARLHAIARVHDQLYQTSDVQRVEIAAYLRALCADLQQSAPASQPLWRIRVAADAMDLPTDQAVPLGLMVNELVTNALKHGQPRTTNADDWTIEVGLGMDAEGLVTISVRDHGPGMPAEAMTGKPKSLGMRLLTGLTRQLDARLTVEDAGPGTRFLVRFRPQPLAPGTEPDR